MRIPTRLLAAVALAMPAIAAAAEPQDYVKEPTVEYGEREIDFKAGTWQLRGDEPARQSRASIGFGWGATPWWFTEAYLKYDRTSPESTRYDALEWENKFQLTEPNQYFADLGILVELEIPRERKVEGYEFKVGPLVQWYTGDVRWNANVFFERVFRGESDPDEPRHTEFSYELQAKVPVRRNLEVGVQAFGDLGPWNHWAPHDEQVHRIGPAIFGKVKLEGREAIRWNVGYLMPLTSGSPKNQFRVQAEYEF
jgi:hypothetical protein